MAATTLHAAGDVAARFEGRAATREPAWVKWTIIAVSLTFFVLFLLMPLIAVFVEALRKGWDTYLAALVEPDALSAIKLTLIAAVIAVPLNLTFGVSAAWAITKFNFRGKHFLITLIDRPALLGVTGGRRPDLRAGVRRAGLVRTLAAGT